MDQAWVLVACLTYSSACNTQRQQAKKKKKKKKRRQPAGSKPKEATSLFPAKTILSRIIGNRGGKNRGKPRAAEYLGRKPSSSLCIHHISHHLLTRLVTFSAPLLRPGTLIIRAIFAALRAPRRAIPQRSTAAHHLHGRVSVNLKLSQYVIEDENLPKIAHPRSTPDCTRLRNHGSRLRWDCQLSEYQDAEDEPGPRDSSTPRTPRKLCQWIGLGQDCRVGSVARTASIPW